MMLPLPILTERQRLTLLTALSLTLQTRLTTPFEDYPLFDVLVDLEDNSLIQYDERLYQLAENKLANLSNSEILEIISEISTHLKTKEIVAV